MTSVFEKLIELLAAMGTIVTTVLSLYDRNKNRDRRPVREHGKKKGRR